MLLQILQKKKFEKPFEAKVTVFSAHYFDTIMIIMIIKILITRFIIIIKNAVLFSCFGNFLSKNAFNLENIFFKSNWVVIIEMKCF